MKKNKWIKCCDQLPKIGGYVCLVYSNTWQVEIECAIYNSYTMKFKSTSFELLHGITHWMEIPENPLDN